MKKEKSRDMKPTGDIDFDRETRVLLEDMRTNIRLVAENHSAIINRLDKVGNRLGAVESRLGSVESEVYSVKMAVFDMNSRLTKVENRLALA